MRILIVGAGALGGTSADAFNERDRCNILVRPAGRATGPRWLADQQSTR